MGGGGSPGGVTDHSEVVVEWLESTAEQGGTVGVGDAADAAPVCGGPEPQGAIQGGRDQDIVGEGPGEVSHATAMAPQHLQHRWRPRRQPAHRDGAIQRAAGQQVPIVMGKLHLRNCAATDDRQHRCEHSRGEPTTPQFPPSGYRRCQCAGRRHGRHRQRHNSRSVLCLRPWHGLPLPAALEPPRGGCRHRCLGVSTLIPPPPAPTDSRGPRCAHRSSGAPRGTPAWEPRLRERRCPRATRGSSSKSWGKDTAVGAPAPSPEGYQDPTATSQTGAGIPQHPPNWCCIPEDGC